MTASKEQQNQARNSRIPGETCGQSMKRLAISTASLSQDYHDGAGLLQEEVDELIRDIIDEAERIVALAHVELDLVIR